MLYQIFYSFVIIGALIYTLYEAKTLRSNPTINSIIEWLENKFNININVFCELSIKEGIIVFKNIFLVLGIFLIINSIVLDYFKLNKSLISFTLLFGFILIFFYCSALFYLKIKHVTLDILKFMIWFAIGGAFLNLIGLTGYTLYFLNENNYIHNYILFDYSNLNLAIFHFVFSISITLIAYIIAHIYFGISFLLWGFILYFPIYTSHLCKKIYPDSPIKTFFIFCIISIVICNIYASF